MTARQAFFFSLLLAVIVSAPLAVVAVAAAWVVEPDPVRLASATSPAVWSARTFIASFDVLVVLTWLPCVIGVKRLAAGRGDDGR